MKKILLVGFIAAIATALFAFQNDSKKEKTYDSEKVVLHGGKVWTSAKVAKDGKPQQVSVVLDDSTLNSVPAGQPSDHFTHANNLMIPIPTESGSPFKFAMVNWNSSGHEPDGVYTLPHFDFHFYMTPQDEVMKFTDSIKLSNLPTAEYVPANHMGVHPIPMMGNHFIDVASPELNGKPFFQTFIYGSYDANVVFYEPMITLDFLKSQTQYEREIPQPAKFKTPGYYPTKLKIVKKKGSTEVILDGFTYRQAS